MSGMAVARTQTVKVLIADDDPGILSFLAGKCAKMGFEVQTAINGIHVLIAARRNPPDVLIVDVNMPGMDGLSACMRLLSPGRAALQVIVITASSSSETPERCDGWGAYYVRKGPELWSSVRMALASLFPQTSNDFEEETFLPVKAWTRPGVLLVDKDQSVEKFLSSRLAKNGVETLYSPDAATGYRIACRERPSVIVSDFYMPDGDALYLLTKLRESAITANIPFFVLCERPLDKATDQRLRREICGRPGAARIIRKQFDVDELFDALQEFCAFDHTAAIASGGV